MMLNGHQSNFPENFSFLHFFPGETLMLLGYSVNKKQQDYYKTKMCCYHGQLFRHVRWLKSSIFHIIIVPNIQDLH